MSIEIMTWVPSFFKKINQEFVKTCLVSFGWIQKEKKQINVSMLFGMYTYIYI